MIRESILTEDIVEFDGQSYEIGSEEIERILPQFVGDIDQVPPIYSAIRVNGRRSYELARSGKIVKHDARKVSIDSFRLKKALYDRSEF